MISLRISFPLLLFTLVFALSACRPVSPDIQSYAQEQHISPLEAADRLAVQDEAGELNAALERNEQETFAGLWLQHEPDFRVVVAFTQDGEETIQPYIQGKSWAHLVQVVEVPFSLTEMLAAQQQVHRLLQEECIEADSAVDVIHNEVQVMVIDLAGTLEILEQKGVSLPDSVRLVQTEGLAEMAALLEGTLVVRDGCLRVITGEDDPGILLILPAYKYRAQIDGENGQILDRDGQVVAQAGEKISIGGGEGVPNACTLRSIPASCPGPYWIAGTIVEP